MPDNPRRRRRRLRAAGFLEGTGEGGATAGIAIRLEPLDGTSCSPVGDLKGSPLRDSGIFMVSLLRAGLDPGDEPDFARDSDMFIASLRGRPQGCAPTTRFTCLLQKQFLRFERCNIDCIFDYLSIAEVNLPPAITGDGGIVGDEDNGNAPFIELLQDHHHL